MTTFYTFLLSSLILIGGCKTAGKSYQKGNFHDAIERGVKNLQKNPDDQETKAIVQQSYNYIVNDHENQIRILLKSRSEDRFEKVYFKYVALQKLYQTINQYPGVAHLIRSTNYSEFIDTYGEKSADIYVDRAHRWINEGTKDGYREAFRELNVAISYRPDDYDLKKKRDEVYESALTKVIIVPVQHYDNYSYGNSYLLQNFQREILRTLHYNLNNDFIKFYTEYQAREQDIDADQVMEINLGRMLIGQPYDIKNIRDVSREVVVKEIVYKPDSVVKQFGQVRARITTTKRTLLSQGDLYISLKDLRGRTIWTDRFTGEHRWDSEFSSYTGDERALSESDKSILNQQQKQPPAENQIMEELLRQIQNDLAYRLRNYYSRGQ